ncbi:PTS sugar transporter subunit IIA [Cohnella sp. JJ-181]|uniref:PTS sugar transporter subunit IIA n=1 Tax=Cohnella rhizoplanae TaxID=2974897 RepID=UPI0022FF6452|nr:PTS glucose transporter subunit IIA [Cohnella sp. JJ-181]CAI6087752.1 PTS system glucose-specific EIIA component [Cohnella sp. JJ-181]
MLSKWLKPKENCQKVTLLAPLSGESVPLSEVPDAAFAQGHIGKGLAIAPSSGRLIAPLSGTVAHVIDTAHAVILEHASGVQILIHIGINTVGLRGRGFKALVKTGDRIVAGQVLIDFDLDLLRSEGYSAVTPIVIVNEDLLTEDIECRYGAVNGGEMGLLAFEIER